MKFPWSKKTEGGLLSIPFPVLPCPAPSARGLMRAVEINEREEKNAIVSYSCLFYFSTFRQGENYYKNKILGWISRRGVSPPPQSGLNYELLDLYPLESVTAEL